MTSLKPTAEVSSYHWVTLAKVEKFNQQGLWGFPEPELVLLRRLVGYDKEGTLQLPMYNPFA